MNAIEIKVHPVEWLLLALAFILPVLVLIPFAALSWCYWHCIPRVVELISLSRWLVYPLAATLMVCFIWSLSVSPKHRRFFIVVITFITVALSVFSLFFGLSITFLQGNDPVTEVHLSDTKNTYFVIQHPSIPEGFAFRLYEQHGLLKTPIARARWRWHSVGQDGASISLVPEEGYNTNYTYNIETGVLEKVESF